MRSLVSWLISVLVFAFVGGLCVYMFTKSHEGGGEAEGREAHATSEPAESKPAEEPAVSRDATGSAVVRMDAETAERVGLTVHAIEAASNAPELIAYGTVQEDPSKAFTLRAPLVGTLAASESGKWPMIGASVSAGAVVGTMLPRFGPLERVDMASRLATARGEVEQSRATLNALRIALESKRTLHAQQKIVSDQALAEAEAGVKVEEAKLKAAEENVRVLDESWSAASRPADGGLPLVVTLGGRVAEVSAQPGEAVESGQALIKVVSFDRLIARVALPAGTAVPKMTGAVLTVSGYEDHPLNADGTAFAPIADPVTGSQTLLLGFAPGDLEIQPGTPVTARLKLAGDALAGVVVPRNAVVRYAGTAWVYVKTGDEAYTRREVTLSRISSNGWFMQGGALSPGDKVVSEAAQVLLSQELKFQTGGGEEEEE